MPLPGARGCSVFKGRNSRLQHTCKKFLGVRATASCPPPTCQSLPVVLVLHGAMHRQAGGKVIVYSVCGEWHAERPCGVEPWRRVRHERDRRDLNVGFARWRDPTKRNVGFSPFPFFLRKNGNGQKPTFRFVGSRHREKPMFKSRLSRSCLTLLHGSTPHGRLACTHRKRSIQ